MISTKMTRVDTPPPSNRSYSPTTINKTNVYANENTTTHHTKSNSAAVDVAVVLAQNIRVAGLGGARFERGRSYDNDAYRCS